MFVPCFVMLYVCVASSSAIVLVGRESWWLYLIVFLMSCDYYCWEALLHEAVSCSAVCDYCIF